MRNWPCGVVAGQAYNAGAMGQCIHVMALGLVFGLSTASAAAKESAEPAAEAAVAETIAKQTPREVIEGAIPRVVELLLDRSVTQDQRSAELEETLRTRAHLGTLSRIMLGKQWDQFDQSQREEFVDVFADYLMSVYVPLMTKYAGERVSVREDYPVGKSDHMVILPVVNTRDGGERQVALIGCRMRMIEGKWYAIDLTVEGISIARVFGLQFRPVIERGGIDELVAQLRAKIKANQEG